MPIPNGTKVISVTNEDEPVTIGIIIRDGRHEIAKEGAICPHFIPVIRCENKNDKIVYSFGVTMPYSNELLRKLESITDYMERWRYAAEHQRKYFPDANK